MGSSAQGGGTNSMPPGTPYLGGTVSGQSTFSGPPGQNTVTPPNQAFPTPQPGSAGPGAAGLSHPLMGLWAGAMLGSLLSQALGPGSNQPGGQGGPMPGGMMPMGAPSPFGPSGFTPGLRGTGSTSGGGGGPSGMGGPR